MIGNDLSADRSSRDHAPRVPWWATLSALAFVTTGGCAESSPAGAEYYEPAAIVIESGDGQEGLAGDFLSEWLAVRVTGAEGEKLSAIDVRWSVTSGEGRFVDPPERSQRPEVIVATRADGVSSLKFMPSALGPIAVTASVESDPSLVVSFTAEANGVLIAIQERQRGEYAIVAPDGSSTVTVPIRTPVEWASQTSSENHVWSDCPDRCPPGGEGFDRVLFPGQRLRFVPDVAGTWEYWAESTFFGILSTMGKLTAVVAG